MKYQIIAAVLIILVLTCAMVGGVARLVDIWGWFVGPLASAIFFTLSPLLVIVLMVVQVRRKQGRPLDGAATEALEDNITHPGTGAYFAIFFVAAIIVAIVTLLLDSIGLI